ncbi:MAG TPA: FHA domain-containing protein [Ktedonobacteraceae bacterium]|nr:FHA domain-containing protein [Ktedonobacteraceae bacterium]
MNATIIGPYGPTPLESTPYPFTIGRASDNRLVVNDPKASSHHAQILPNGQGYEIMLLSAIAFGAYGYANRSTPTKTLNAFTS